jgi:hypothetical protein
MEVLRELMKKPRQTDTLAIGVFVVAMIYAIVAGTPHTILAGLAFILMVLGALPRQMSIAFLVGASVILLLQTSSKTEGFSSGAGSGTGEAEVEPTEGSPAAEEKKETSEGFAGKKKPMLPDNATRKEPLVLGKAYTLPSEEDDKGYHLDAGTTFMNAYKSLKPDQIAAMTRDTQELLATQKSLVAMLDSFAPLMKDMDKITGFFK